MSAPATDRPEVLNSFPPETLRALSATNRACADVVIENHRPGVPVIQCLNGEMVETPAKPCSHRHNAIPHFSHSDSDGNRLWPGRCNAGRPGCRFAGPQACWLRLWSRLEALHHGRPEALRYWRGTIREKYGLSRNQRRAAAGSGGNRRIAARWGEAAAGPRTRPALVSEQTSAKAIRLRFTACHDYQPLHGPGAGHVIAAGVEAAMPKSFVQRECRVLLVIRELAQAAEDDDGTLKAGGGIKGANGNALLACGCGSIQFCQWQISG